MIRCSAAGSVDLRRSIARFLPRRRQVEMRLYRLGQLPADRVQRVQRRQRILEDRADLAPRMLRIASEAGCRSLAFEPYLARPMRPALRSAEIAAPVIDLPAPDSPTTPSTSPRDRETTRRRRIRACRGAWEFDP